MIEYFSFPYLLIPVAEYLLFRLAEKWGSKEVHQGISFEEALSMYKGHSNMSFVELQRANKQVIYQYFLQC